MAKKQCVIDYLVDDVNQLLRYKANKVFYIKDYKGKDKVIEYDVLRNLTFGTVIDIINNKQLYVAKSVEIVKEVPIKTKPVINIKPKEVKFSLDDVYKQS